MALQVTVDRVGDLVQRVRALTTLQVLVGVPGTKTDRKGNEPITNAALAYIHNFGSPARNIPQREFMEPGIRAAMPEITAQLRRAAEKVLDKTNDPERHLHAAGQAAAQSIQQKIVDGPFTPLQPRTIERRLARRHPGATMADVTNGSIIIKPLIDTGAMRQSITYVLRHTGLGPTGKTPKKAKNVTP